MDRIEDSPLYQIMHPKSIAFWGASSNNLAMGTVQLAQMLEMGFEGKIYPIHPREKIIMGLPAYEHIKDVPDTVDLAVLILPTSVVPEILEELGQAGVRRAIIVTAGFGEMGSDGKELQNRLVETANKYGISFIGPNCIGVVNSYAKLNTTFFPYVTSPGFIGMASQSGSFVTQMFTHLAKFGIGFSQAFSIGNEAVVDIADCLEYLGKCPNTTVIGLYIEAIKRGRDFFRIAREVSKTKPIVAFYVGGSESGKKAVRSHTGAMAGPDLLYDGFFKQCGIIRARSIEELFDFCYVLGSQPLPNGNKIAILTHSGGPGAAAADAAERSGLKLSELTPKTLEILKTHVPHTASVSNPVDLTFNKRPTDYSEIMPGILLDDENVDLLFMYMLMPVYRVVQSMMASGIPKDQATEMADRFIEGQAEAVAKAAKASGKPMVGGSFYTREEPLIRHLQDKDMAVLPSPERAVIALAALARYAAKRKALIGEG